MRVVSGRFVVLVDVGKVYANVNNGGGAMVWQRARWFGVGGSVDICIAVKTYLLARVLVWCGARSNSAARTVVRRGARAGNLHGA